MRFLIVLAFLAVVYVGAIVPIAQNEFSAPMFEKIASDHINFSENDDDGFVISYNEDEENLQGQSRFILSWQVRRMIKKLQKQMPCGWPEYGIPPLAPLSLSEGTMSFKKGVFETLNKVFRFQISDLDKFKIKKFKLNIIAKKISFDFLFKNIDISAEHYETDTFLNTLQQLGVSVQYTGDGSLGFGFTNLRIAGILKYKLPMLWGSATIISLKTTFNLEKCHSNIRGLVGDGAVNSLINRQIENLIEKSMNNNQQQISDKIEETLVPKVNKMLKGNDFWTLIDLIFSSDEKEDDPIITNCVPPPKPWQRRSSYLTNS